MQWTVAQRNAGVDYVKQRITTLESTLNSFQKAFVPQITDVQILSEVDGFLAAIAKAK